MHSFKVIEMKNENVAGFAEVSYWVVDSGLLSIRIMVSSYFLIAVTEVCGLKDNMLNQII